MELIGGPFYTGGTIHVRGSLFPRQSFFVREGHIELVCTERYWWVYLEGRSQRYTRRLVHLSESFLRDMEVSAGVPYRNEVSFPIHAPALPSINGKTARITWEVRYWLDIASAGDIHQEQAVVILPPPKDGDVDESNQ